MKAPDEEMHRAGSVKGHNSSMLSPTCLQKLPYAQLSLNSHFTESSLSIQWD